MNAPKQAHVMIIEAHDKGLLHIRNLGMPPVTVLQICR